MSYGWKGNRRSGVALAMRQTQTYVVYSSTGSGPNMEMSISFRLHMEYGTFTYIVTSIPPGKGAKYCDEYVCLSVRLHNSKTT